MQFFKIIGVNRLKDLPEERDEIIEMKGEIIEATTNFNAKLDGDAGFYFSSFDTKCLIGAVTKTSKDIEKLTEKFLAATGVALDKIKIEEITMDEFTRIIRGSCRHHFIDDDDEVYDTFNFSGLTHSRNYGITFGESVIDCLTKEDAYEMSHKLIADDTLRPELDRIYASERKKRIPGHPCHYMIECDDRDTRRTIHKVLINALHDCGRISNKRYAFTDLGGDDRFSTGCLDNLYSISKGGALIIRYNAVNDEDGEFASADRQTIEVISDMIRKYRNKVLTILCFPRECTKARDTFFEYLSGMAFVEIKEEFVKDERAREVLSSIAKDNGVRPNKKLLNSVKEGQKYLVTDLKNLYEEWFNARLQTDIFPQYKDIERHAIVKEQHKGNAYKDLEEMIGLAEAKKVINQALDYHKAQKLFRSKGMKTEHPSMHMCFTGNPGSAKTTVARYFASIMADNGILSKGTFVEVSRADIVGKYVGHTAPNVKKLFKRAEGGVLFIDEAYSLVDDRDGSFGDEAIDEIVKSMEDYRDSVCVIFAGYPDKMEKFLQKNPGLRSRIAFHVSFEDYDADELTEIAKLIAGKRGLTLTDKATEKLHKIYEDAASCEDFGNGRYVRNTIEKAVMAQSSRLVHMDFDSIGPDDVKTITEDDIEYPKNATKEKPRTIGFCA